MADVIDLRDKLDRGLDVPCDATDQTLLALIEALIADLTLEADRKLGAIEGKLRTEF
jgi:hypothetical protein